MDFSEALIHCKDKIAISRVGWNRQGIVVKVLYADEDSKMTEPFLYSETEEGFRRPWLPRTDDLFASDWTLTLYV